MVQELTDLLHEKLPVEPEKVVLRSLVRTKPLTYFVEAYHEKSKFHNDYLGRVTFEIPEDLSVGPATFVHNITIPKREGYSVEYDARADFDKETNYKREGIESMPQQVAISHLDELYLRIEKKSSEPK